MTTPPVPPIPEVKHETAIRYDSGPSSHPWIVECTACMVIARAQYERGALDAKRYHDTYAGFGVTEAEIINVFRVREEFLTMIEADTDHNTYERLARAWGRERGRMSNLEALRFLSHLQEPIGDVSRGQRVLHHITTSDVVSWYLQAQAVEMMGALVDDVDECATCQGPCGRRGTT